ncbi:MAG: hypothetical protein LBI42_06420 [Chitinispirillales bacterium]|jgi:hypothetical protein|nr:hypothetical protein [Chitinispirillales bacterium]
MTLEEWLQAHEDYIYSRQRVSLLRDILHEFSPYRAELMDELELFKKFGIEDVYWCVKGESNE